MYTYETDRVINAPADAVWAVISDHALFGQVAPNLHQVVVLAGEGAGMQRRCTGKDGSEWGETCTLWQPGKVYAFEVVTSDKSYPFKKMTGTFTMDEIAAGIRVGMRFDYIPKFNPPLFGWLVNWLLARGAATMTQAIFDGWNAAIKERTPVNRVVNAH